MLYADLPSPAVLIDRTRLLANLDEMASTAMHEGVALRPHTKTHKSVELARLQRDRGADGLTVAKVGEAEVFAAHGFTDIRMAYVTRGEEKWARMRKLAADGVTVSFCIDTLEGARAASDSYVAAGTTAPVLLEIDCGYGRCGLRWDHPDMPETAAAMAALPGLEIIGILTHAGHAYNGPSGPGETKEAALRRVSAEERDRMLEAAARLEAVGVAWTRVRNDTAAAGGRFEISIGSTPSIRYFENAERGGFRITEIRPGNYVYLDATQVGLGVQAYDRCALTVFATVISKHRNTDGSERLFLDAGKKVLTSDGAFGHEGYGVILYNHKTMEPLPHHRITGLSEEHGWVHVRGGSTLAVGDTVRVVPNHACVVVNTQRAVHVVDGDDLVATWAVDAQSRVT